MTTALEGGEGSASRPGLSLPQGKTRYPLYRRLGGPQGRSGQVRKISPPPGFDPRTVQPVASRYIDWATINNALWKLTPCSLVIIYSLYSVTTLRAGLSGVRIFVGTIFFFSKSPALGVSQPLFSRCLLFPREQSSQVVRLTIYYHMVRIWRLREAIYPLPPYAFMVSVMTWCLYPIRQCTLSVPPWKPEMWQWILCLMLRGSN